MTVDEGKWVSSCILAHVNMQGTHQYISLRGNPPNLEAQVALELTPGRALDHERLPRRLLRDLFDVARDLSRAPVPWMDNQLAALASDGEQPTDPPLEPHGSPDPNIVLGRDCDAGNCLWTNADGNHQRDPPQGTVLETCRFASAR